MQILEGVGLLAPVAGFALILIYVRAIPRRAFSLAVIGCILLGASLIIGSVGQYTMIYSGIMHGEVSALLDHSSLLTVIRVSIIILGSVALGVAGVIDREPSSRPVAWLSAGIILSSVGLVANVVLSIVEHLLAKEGFGGVAVVVILLGESLTFAVLHIGAFTLAIAVVKRRGASKP
ncbi:hypothetical protein [Brevibacterium atlanticum]|uniref:hypothetical protein n=1 Tax=Brevibacterium atlanticum TaxID=2697563 RepID=UPI0014236B38|nr:hypothetical protein [Brevibacterium atlanticum]